MVVGGGQGRRPGKHLAVAFAQLCALDREKRLPQKSFEFGKRVGDLSPVPTAMIITGTPDVAAEEAGAFRSPRAVPSTPRNTEAPANPSRCNTSHTARYAGRPSARSWRPT